MLLPSSTVKKTCVLLSTAAVALAVACSSSDQFASSEAGAAGAGAGGQGGHAGSAGSAGTAGSAGASGSAGATDAGVDATTDDAPFDVTTTDAGDGEACADVTWYQDGDHDGYGGTTTFTGCAPPLTGTWVTDGGDCDDSNGDVHPGQVNYFPQGFTQTGTGKISFDYDCSGSETEAGSNPRIACKASGLGCSPAGYIPADPPRAGAGVDPYCGSTQEEDCTKVTLVCTASAPYAAPAIPCH